MKSFLTHIEKEVIIPEYIYSLSSQEIKGTKFILPEMGNEASCKEARFKKIEKEKVLVYKFDKIVKNGEGNEIEEPFLFFKSGKARAKADYLIFYPFFKRNEEKIYVIICNMKSKNKGNNYEQLQAGESFARFIIETAIRIYGEEINKKRIVFSQVLFWDKPILRKGYTNPRKASTSYKKGEGGYIEFDCKNQTCDLQLLCQLN